jgi:hypothetical protein
VKNKLNKFPFITAEFLGKNKTEGQANCYLFNSVTNRGYSVEGLAAILCKSFDGTNDLLTCIKTLESDYELAENAFEQDIDHLIKDLEDNGLVEFLDSKKES